MTKDEKYYIARAGGGLGIILWWKPHRSGYTVSIDQAGLYSREEAEAIQWIRGTDLAFPQSSVEKHAIRVVSSENFTRLYRPAF